MQAAYIIPLTRLPSHLEGFDYSIPPDAKNSIMVGSIVEVLLRNRKTKGIVFKIHESSIDSLKPIARVMPSECAISHHDRTLLEWLSSYYAIAPSVAALQMAPFLDGTRDGITVPVHRSNEPQPILLYSPSHKERVEYYRNIIRQQSAINAQTLILCPTIANVYELARELSDCAPTERIAIIHSALGKPVFRTNAQSLRDGTALLAIGTRMLAFAPCAALGYVIIHDSERIEHKQYDSSPRYDGRVVGLAKATIARAQACISSTAPRLEEWQQKNDCFIYQEIPAETKTTVVNLSDEMRNENYSFISDSLIGWIKNTLQEQKQSYLVLSGSGYSRFVMCASCSYLFTCISCNRLPRYSQTSASLKCSLCDSSQQLPPTCPLCKGSQYTFPGLGREKIISYLKKQFPDTSIGEISASRKRGRENFAITVGGPYSYTDYAREYSPLGLLAFIAADPALSTTDFRATERQWQTAAACISHASLQGADIVIQSFSPHAPFIQTLAKMDFAAFSNAELAARKETKQPPFSRMVRVFQSTRVKFSEAAFLDVKSSFETIARSSKNPRIIVNEVTLQKQKKSSTELVITVDVRYHPSHLLPEYLLKMLRSLPKGFIHDIDPL